MGPLPAAGVALIVLLLAPAGAAAHLGAGTRWPTGLALPLHGSAPQQGGSLQQGEPCHAAAAQCKLSILGGNNNTISHARLVCSGAPVVVAVNRTLLGPFLLGSFKGVALDPAGCYLHDAAPAPCLLTFCGKTSVHVDGPMVMNVADKYLSESGAAICAFDRSQVVLVGARFAGNQVTAAWVSDTATLQIKDSSFANNSAVSNGGTLYADGSSSLALSNCSMSGASGKSGGALHVSENATVVIRHSVIRDSTSNDGSGGAIAIGGSASATMEHCTLSNNHAQYGFNGGAVSLQDNGSLAMTGCDMVENVAAQGGTVAVENAAQLNMTNCTISKSRSSDGEGGAVSIRGSAAVSMEHTTLDNNRAQGGYSGGAVWLIANASLAMAGCAMVDNVAEGGGAVAVEGAAQLHMSNCTISKSVSHLAAGGAVVAYDHASITMEHCTLSNNHAQGGYSGGAVYALDHASLAMAICTFQNNTVNALGKGIDVWADLGVVLVLQGSNINKSSPSVYQVHTQCLLGEVKQKDGTCAPCVTPTYSLNTSAVACDTCPADASCLGDANITPDAGFWHSHPYSTAIHACPRPSSCLEGGVCIEGYDAGSNVCGACSEGYGLLSPFRCSKCPSRGTALALYVSAAVGMFLLLTLLVFTTLRDNAAGGAVSSDSAHPSEYLKLVVRHLQFLWLIGSVGLQWPGGLAAVFKAVGWAMGGTSLQVAPLACLFSRDPNGVPLPLKQLLLYLLAPFGMLVALLLVRLAARCLGKLLRRPPRYSLGSVACVCSLVTFFFFYPVLFRSGLSLFACYRIDDPAASGSPYPEWQVANASAGYWLMDMQQACYQGYHLVWALGLGLPCVLFCLAVPLVLAAVLANNKHRLDRQGFRGHAGFLYQFYRRERFYWESLSLLSVAALVAIGTFSWTLGAYYAVVLINVGLGLLCFLAFAQKPHLLHDLNQAQLLSLSVLYGTSSIALTLFSMDVKAPAVYGQAMAVIGAAANLAFVCWCIYCMVLLSSWRRVAVRWLRTAWLVLCSKLGCSTNWCPARHGAAACCISSNKSVELGPGREAVLLQEPALAPSAAAAAMMEPAGSWHREAAAAAAARQSAALPQNEVIIAG